MQTCERGLKCPHPTKISYVQSPIPSPAACLLACQLPSSDASSSSSFPDAPSLFLFLPFLHPPSPKTDHHCQHKNNDVQLFTYAQHSTAHSLFPYELKRISPPPPPPPPILPPLLPLSDNAIYNTAAADDDDGENFLITLTAFRRRRRRRRPMDDDRERERESLPSSLSSATNMNEVRLPRSTCINPNRPYFSLHFSRKCR